MSYIWFSPVFYAFLEQTQIAGQSLENKKIIHILNRKHSFNQ